MESVQKTAIMSEQHPMVQDAAGLGTIICPMDARMRGRPWASWADFRLSARAISFVQSVNRRQASPSDTSL